MGERAICGFIKEDGEPCRAWPAKKRGLDVCMAHGAADDLAKSREDARLRKLSEREMRKPPSAWFSEGWNVRPFRPVDEAVSRFDKDKSTITRWQAWTVFHEAREKAALEVPRPDGLPLSHFDWTVEHIPILIEGFLKFREKYFKTERGQPFVSPKFQQKWASHVIAALVTGGREMILAPQRHGKTRLLTHLCIYLFCLDPNLRVLWVSVTQTIAEYAPSLMRGIFETNEQLIEDYAGPGATFQPATRSLHKWTNSEFTLATRTNMEIPGPNVKALGRGGSILSMNADIIIVDDIEDDGSTVQLGTREKTKQWWFTQLQSRKEEHTGLFVIGSRQHADDLYSQILQSPDWDIIIEQAHDPACDVKDSEGHWACLLFPEVRTYKWLMGQKRAAKTPAHFEMIYQNVARTAGLVVFPEGDLHACRNPNYAAGDIPGKRHGAQGVTLIGGLDPSISGYQAGVLFAYQTVPELKIWLVDMDNKEGGGTTAFVSLIRRWYEKYGLVSWVAELNTFGELSTHQEIRDYTGRHGIQVSDSHTGTNKNHQFFGVTGLAPLFEDRNIILPYADEHSQALTDEVITQFAIWDEGNSRNKNRTGYKDDIVMACWLAYQPIRRANQMFNAELGVDNTDPLTSAMTDGWDDAPWDDWSLAV